jgi:hypothetical protein
MAVPEISLTITKKKNVGEQPNVFLGSKGNSKNSSNCGNVTMRPMSRTAAEATVEATITNNLD